VQPIGSNQGTVNVAGRNWELWYGLNGNMKVFSFVAPSPVNSFSANLKDFFNYMANNKGYPAGSQYLISESCESFYFILFFIFFWGGWGIGNG